MHRHATVQQVSWPSLERSTIQGRCGADGAIQQGVARGVSQSCLDENSTLFLYLLPYAPYITFPYTPTLSPLLHYHLFFHHSSCNTSTISCSLEFVATPALAPLEVQVDAALLEQYNKELQEVCLGHVSTKTLKTPPCSHVHHT